MKKNCGDEQGGFHSGGDASTVDAKNDGERKAIPLGRKVSAKIKMWDGNMAAGQRSGRA